MEREEGVSYATPYHLYHFAGRTLEEIHRLLEMPQGDVKERIEGVESHLCGGRQLATMGATV